ncbi:MAG: sialate O-acetylesterase, partial [Oscillospiraceae bacterium]
KVSADNKELVFKNITFGDVWMCFGQSNMEYYMIMGEDTKADVSTRKGIASADNPQIRVLNLWNKGIMGANSAVDNLPLNKGETVWAEMDADHANYCSAIGYYFSQSINKKHDTPVGLLNLAVGDTEIGRWIPKDFKKNDFVSQDGDLYNNRIFPFGKLNIKGIIMYQGEADEYRTHLTAELYSDAMSAVVDKYRQIWGEDLPFYWTQITRYKSDESLVREGQRLALEKVANPKNIGMVCLLDQFGKFEGGAGNAREDIHPMGKKEVAERFLRFAERDIYSNELSAPSGPEYLSMEVVGNTVELKFKYTEALKIMPKEQYSDKQTQEYIKNNNVNTNELHEFWIAGEDDVYVPAKAVIDGGKVIVWSDEIDNPHNVRYAWGGYPQMPNLTDGSGLPTSTFSTKRGL